MSLLQRCDICGKTEEKTNFDPRPIKIQIPNHKKENINVFINIFIEDPEDSTKIINFNTHLAMINMMNENPNVIVMNEDGNDINEDDMAALEQQTFDSLKIQNPRICKKCTREMMKLAASYGSFDKAINICGENYKMPKKEK